MTGRTFTATDSVQARCSTLFYRVWVPLVLGLYWTTAYWTAVATRPQLLTQVVVGVSLFHILFGLVTIYVTDVR